VKAPGLAPAPKTPTDQSHATGDAGDWTIVDDFPTSLPVSSAETVVLEIYLRDLLDEVLGGSVHGQ